MEFWRSLAVPWISMESYATQRSMEFRGTTDFFKDGNAKFHRILSIFEIPNVDNTCGSMQYHTVYPKKYAHGFCFAVLCCDYTLTDFPLSINLTISPVPAKQPWWIWINTSSEFIMNDCITKTKQSTTKPCAYFWGYTVEAFMSSKMWDWNKIPKNSMELWVSFFRLRQ